MKQKLTQFVRFVTILVPAAVLTFTHSEAGPSCGNSGADPSGPPTTGSPGDGDPFVAYTGNEYRKIDDLRIWGGVGEHQLTWTRWANSRFVGGQNYFGDGHNWRHSYQWEMADAAPSSSGQAQLEIIYPEGYDNIFTQKTPTSTSWTPIKSIEDSLTQSGTNFYLQRKNGFRYHFTKNVAPAGGDYYLMTDFTDAEGNDYVLTYNSANQVTQVTEPGGRFLQINYTTVNLNKVDFTTVASTSGLVVDGVPPEGQWTTVTVTDPTPYRYLRYLSADGGHCDVAEVQFYDTSGNLLSGTPFGVTPPNSPSSGFANAFDGNTSTYVDLSIASGGFCGIDLGPGNATAIGKVMFYPRAGKAALMEGPNWWAPSGHGQFQGSNQAPVTETVVSSVTTSDGRTISYNYTPYNDATLPYVYQTLTSVNYDDGTQATYSYNQVFPSTTPLVTSYVDPRYTGPFKRSKTTYWPVVASALGEVNTQVNADTAQAVYTLDSTGPHTPIVSMSTGGIRTYNMSLGQLETLSDAVGNTTQHSYDSKGFESKLVDGNSNPPTLKTNSTFDNLLSETLPDSSTRTWTRDSLDLPLTYKNERGFTTTFTRDTSHRPTAIGYPDGTSDTFTYNGFGEPLTHTQRNGQTESAIFDPTGLKTSSTDAAGHATTYTYDSLSRLASATDANSHSTTYQYNAKGQVTLITYADGSTHAYSYDTYGNKLTDTDELGHTTTYTYDTFNRCTSITDADSRQTQYVYRSNYYLTKPDEIISPSGKITRNTYDNQNHLLSQTIGYGTADAATTSYFYDHNYNVTSTTDPKGNVWTYTYDSRNRKLSQTDPLSHTTSYTYDNAGNVLTVIRPDGGVTTNTYDSMNRLLTTQDPKGETTTMTYYPAGNLKTTTDARGNTYTYTYDALNRRTSLAYPDGSVERYGYDAVGNLVSYTTRAGQVKTSTFDNRNREVSYSWSDGVTPNVTRSYDVAGRLLSSDNGVSTSTYCYDNANQLVSETQTNANVGTGWVVAYTYDIDGNRTSVTYPSGTVVGYGYTNRNQANSITVNSISAAGYTYDPNGNVLTKTMADGTLASYAYDTANRLTTLNHTLAGASFARFDYGYDSVNRRTFEQRDSAGGDVYGYDAVDQVASVSYDAANPSSGSTGTDRAVGYTYDAVGNRTALTDSVNGNTSYTANNLNQYSSVGGESYAYDGNGNLVTGTGINSYDAQNRLTYAQQGSNIDQLQYDSKNRVVERTVNGTPLYLVYDNWNLIEERDGSNNLLATYVHGVGQDELISKIAATASVYYHTNALGSVTDLTSSTGIVVEKYKYDAYGKPSITDGSGSSLTASAYGNRFMFTGREFLAEVNLYDFRNRVYSADLGRFMQTDPIRFSAGDINIYRYLGNNALNLMDPTGEGRSSNARDASTYPSTNSAPPGPDDANDDDDDPMSLPGEVGNPNPLPPDGPQPSLGPVSPSPLPPPDPSNPNNNNPLPPDGPQPQGVPPGPSPIPPPVPPPDGSTDLPGNCDAV